MKKQLLSKTTIAVCVLVGASFLMHSSDATMVSLDDWYAINSNANAQITDGDTTSPTYENIGTAGIDRFYTYFNPVTLADGETLTMSFTLTLSLTEPATNKVFSDFRFGVFEASTPHSTTTTFGADRVSSSSASTANWQGFLLRDPGNASGPLRLYRKSGTGNNGFQTTGDSVQSANLTTTGGYSFAFEHEVARTFTMVMERDGNDLVISGSYGAGNFNSIVSGAFTESGYNVFDAFGFYAASSDGVLIETAQFTNVTLQVVPEPVSGALLLIGGGALLLTHGRKIKY